MARRGLGRGLDALLAENTAAAAGGAVMLRVADIEPNRKQARKAFDAEGIAELSASIREHGLIQPIVVRRKPNGFYEIIAGERRWRACRAAGITEVPVIIKEADDISASLISLVENLQRENLNPVEEAFGYQSLMETFGLTQEKAAAKVGKSRPAVANSVRLLALPEKILDLVAENRLSYGHARALLPLMGHMAEGELFGFALRVTDGELSVRETEKAVKARLKDPAPPKKSPRDAALTANYYKSIESDASSLLGRKMTIKEKQGKGSVNLSFSSPEDLERLLQTLCGADFFENR